MNSLDSMVMPETLLITRALANKVSISYALHIHTQTDTQCNSNSYFTNINVFMHSVSSGLHVTKQN